VLECAAALLQVGHFAFDVVDLPDRLTRSRRPGVRRRVEEARGLVAELVDHAAAHFKLGPKAELALVELSSASDVLGRNVSVQGRFLQHHSLRAVEKRSGMMGPRLMPVLAGSDRARSAFYDTVESDPEHALA